MRSSWAASAAVVLSFLFANSVYCHPSAGIGSEIAPDGACPATITQSSSQTITLGNSVGCSSGPPDYIHRAESFWRAFNMAQFTNSQQYNVTSVSFGIEGVQSGNGQGQSLTVRLYTNSGGAFPGGVRAQIGSATVTAMDQVGMMLSVPLVATVPAGAPELIMEVAVPDGVQSSDVFSIGSNAATQTGPSYISALSCGSPDPVDTASIGFPDTHLVFNVNGSCSTGMPAKTLNISTRMRVELGDNAMIGGFVVTGTTPKSIIVRAMGPSLAGAGIPDVLSDPALELHGSDGSLIYANNNWRDDPAQAAQIQGTAYQPGDDRESAMIRTLAPGAYTVVVTGQNQTTGVALIEIYDNNQAVDSQLSNLSTRGFVQSGTNVMIGGFILGGETGITHVAIRGLGPSLSQLGLQNVLTNSTLELHDSNGATLVSNDNWQDDPTSANELASRGLALPNSLEAGIFVTLSPGAYTAILAGNSGGVGIGLVELYNLH